MKRLLLIIVLITTAILTFAQEKYAVLICGDKPVETTTFATNPSTWGDPGDEIKNEFWNDTFLMWEMLVTEKGYDENNVYVLYYDSDDYDITGLAGRYKVESEHPGYGAVTDYKASKEKVEMVFGGLATGTNGFPLVTEDDFLFVWTFGHGTPGEIPPEVAILLYGSAIDESEFADAVNPINAGKKVFWMQNCKGGNFCDNLENNNTVFNSAGSVGENAAPADDNWDTENEVRNSVDYQHGEFNFHNFSAMVGLTPYNDNSYGIEQLDEADLNNDNYISVYEAWQWEQSHETKLETPLYSDLGNIGPFTSLEYPTLLHQNITTNQTHRGLIGISKTIHITQGNQLTLKQNSDVTILNNSELIVDAGATLVIENNVKFRGNTSNKIIVNGNIQTGEDVVFMREGNSGYFSGIYFYNESSTINLKKPPSKIPNTITGQKNSM